MRFVIERLGQVGWRQVLLGGVYLVPLLFLAAFFFYPLGMVLRLGLTAEAWGAVSQRPYLWDTIWFTFWQAGLSTLLTLVVGLPGAYLFARYDFRGRDLLRALTTVPFVMPTVVVAAALRALFGGQGPINQGLMWLTGASAPPIRLEQSLAIILIAHVFYNVTIIIRLVGGFWAHLNPNLVAAARVMGATRWGAFREVTWPLLRPALVSAILLVYLFTFSSFGVILILGGARFNTIETEIYQQYVTYLRPDIAAVLSLLQILFTFILMAVYGWWQRQHVVRLDLRSATKQLKRPKLWREKLVVVGLITGLSLFLLTPLLALVWRSLVGFDGVFTLAYYEALPTLRRGSLLFVAPLTAVRNSLGYALMTMVAACLLGVPTVWLLTRQSRWGKWLDPLFMLPLGASAVTLGLGYVVSYDELRTSPWLVLIAHTLVAFPFVVRSLLPVVQGIQPSLREAAAVLGASPWQVWREVDWPIMGRALLVAAVFAFTVSMGEFGATSFIVRPNSGYLTLPIAINRYLGQPGALNFGQAMAMSTILMAVCTVGFVAIERFRYGDVGEF
ncbi:MAG TPA: iron ABC transporter permease [Anaerolineae bacterium]|nr:iron ABC transporter permease [Anaerolineae bacterium]